MGMALHSEFDGADGFAVFDAWSQTAEKYDAKQARDVWKSFKPGPVKIGTLIDEAKRHGCPPPISAVQVPQESSEDTARRTAEREQRVKAAKAVGGRVAVPSGLPDGSTDFDDLTPHSAPKAALGTKIFFRRVNLGYSFFV